MKHLLDFCKQFRITQLGLTLEEVENLTWVKAKTLSAFENGRSTNINHLNVYFGLCKDKEQRALFVRGFDNAMDKDKKERLDNA